MRDKAPFEYLDPGKNFEEHAIVHSGSPNKVEIITNWTNLEGIEFSKKQLVQVY
jgi:hypothetical protein